MQLNGKVVLIAGGSGALGQTFVPVFVVAGARVIRADQHPPSVQAERCTDMKADATDEADVRRLVDEVIQTAGHIDALINLVGGFAIGRVVETDASLWHRTLALSETNQMNQINPKQTRSTRQTR
jgi:NAD(P)-dependent dehydrogenase (short-subunit alcohol dehydrogenase family)